MHTWLAMREIPRRGIITIAIGDTLQTRLSLLPPQLVYICYIHGSFTTASSACLQQKRPSPDYHEGQSRLTTLSSHTSQASPSRSPSDFSSESTPICHGEALSKSGDNAKMTQRQTKISDKRLTAKLIRDLSFYRLIIRLTTSFFRLRFLLGRNLNLIARMDCITLEVVGLLEFVDSYAIF